MHVQLVTLVGKVLCYRVVENWCLASCGPPRVSDRNPLHHWAASVIVVWGEEKDRRERERERERWGKKGRKMREGRELGKGGRDGTRDEEGGVHI